MAVRITKKQLQSVKGSNDPEAAKTLLRNLVREARSAEQRIAKALPKVLDQYEPALVKARDAVLHVIEELEGKSSPAKPESTPAPVSQAAQALTASTEGAPQVDLGIGSEGADVLALQNALVKLGYLTAAQQATGPGIFGPKTQAALEAFQADWGVPSTGYYGELSRAALTKALAGESKPEHPAGTWDGSTPAPGTTNTNAWVPANPPVKGDPAERSAATYDQVIDEFAVGVNPRYTPRNGTTFCNIFAWDVTRAMGAEIPHWVNGAGQPVGVGEGSELDANATNQWLHQHGAEHGWRQVSAAEAQALANDGHPAVASWRNPGGIGHIGVVRPGSDEGNGPALAQAGAKNFNHGHVYDVFPKTGTEFWVNDAGSVATQPAPSQPSQPSTPPSPPPAAPTPSTVEAGAPEVDLQRGSEGAEVEALQRALVKLGFLSEADFETGPGTFGPRTENALKAFQSANGVPSTGYYGPLSRAALKAVLSGAPAPTPTPVTPPPPAVSAPGVDLEIGANGPEVEQLQRALVQLGCLSQDDMNTGPGIFGPRTQAAVRAFQAKWNVPTTGYYGPLTRAAMTQALSGAQPPAPAGIPGAEQAIAFASNPGSNPQDPRGTYHYWCLALVYDSYKSAGRVLPELQKPKAYDAYLAYANEGKIQQGGTPPRGALVFFNSYMPYGHIGISMGDGTYVGSLESGPQSGIRSLSTPTYLGWAYP